MTKAEIRTAFQSILNNTSCTTALADTFIDEGIARSQRLLKLPSQETLLTTVADDAFTGITVPSDYLRGMTIYYEQNSLKRVSLGEYYKQVYGAGTTATPSIWTRNRTKLLIGPVPAEDVTVYLLYYATFDEFTSDSTETELSAAAPDLFIYGALTYAADRFEDTRGSRWEQRYQAIIQELQDQADIDELSGEATIAFPEAARYPTEDY